MKNKLLICIILVILIIGTVSCEDSDSINNHVTSKVLSSSSSVLQKDQYQIAFVPPDQYDYYWYRMKAGCEKAVADLKSQGTNINFSFDPPSHDPPQDSVLRSIINNGEKQVDAIITVPYGDSLDESYEFADQHNVPIVFIDAFDKTKAMYGSYCDAAYMSNYYNDGKLTGEQLIKGLEKEQQHTGSIIVLLEKGSSPYQKQREEGFKSVFNNTQYKLIEKNNFGDDTQDDCEYLENMLTTDDKNNVVGIVCFNSMWLNFISENIENANVSDIVLFISFDAYNSLEDITEAFHSGALDASIDTDPFQMGYQGLMGAVKLLRGNEIDPKVVDIPPIVVTKDNYEEYFEEIDRQVKQSGYYDD